MNPKLDELTDFRQRYLDALATDSFGRSVRWLKTTGSTNDVARQWASEGAPEGSLVFTNDQTRGKGRQGRTWLATPRMNLTISVILRPLLDPGQFGLITLAAGVAIAECIEECCVGIKPKIKWPNDVLLEGRKCCGMLLESSIGGSSEGPVVILGIGLNVNQTDFPGDLATTATSMTLVCGQPMDRVGVLAVLLRRLEQRYTQVQKNPGQIVGDYEGLLEGIGSTVRLEEVVPGRWVEGVMAGIDETGAILIQTETGRRAYHAGDVTVGANENLSTEI